MKIAQFTSSLIEPLGGAEQYCLALARHQKRSGEDVTVVTGWADDSVVAGLAADGIPVTVIPSDRPYSPDRKGDSTAAKIAFHGRELLDSLHRTAVTRTLENSGFDVVHVHRFAGFGTAVLRLRGVKVVHTAHDFSIVDTSASLVKNDAVLTRPALVQRLRSAFATRGLAASTTFVFPSARTRDRHTEWGFRTDSFDSVVIPHGWQKPVSAAPERTRRTPGAALRVLFLGKLAGHKGIPLLLDAWGSGIPGAELRIAGDGPLAADVRNRPGVTALGWLDETQRTAELALADVLVFPSEWPENFPIVVAESILAGVPVLTTTVASPPLVDDGESGLLVESTPAALRDALVRLADDESFRSRLAAGARDRATQLDMTVHATRILEAYGVSRTSEPGMHVAETAVVS